MKPERSAMVHGGILLVAAVCAFQMWTREEVGAGPSRRVEAWAGTGEQVQRIEWESERKVVLEARQDAVGRYFVGTMQKTLDLPPKRDDPKALQSVSKSEDGGAKKAKGKQETIRFISVESASHLADSLAPLKALRFVGQVEDARLGEFGLDQPKGTLRVTVANKAHTLVMGGPTPGGSDHYAKEVETGAVYAVQGDMGHKLEFADSKMLERNLHDFESKEVTRVSIGQGEKHRELVAVPGKQNAWADPSTPDTQDETAGNWISKLNVLAVSEFFEQPPEPLGQDALVVRVDYYAGRKSRGFLELYRLSGDEKESDFLVRTEYLRWYGKLRKGSAGQLEQDLGSVLK
ncbi:DUF4340 domain-containing protein [Myxococcota bacterium]